MCWVSPWLVGQGVETAPERTNRELLEGRRGHGAGMGVGSSWVVCTESRSPSRVRSV